MTPKTLESKIIKTELIDWQRMQFIQQEDFKNLSPEAMERLKQSILANHFLQPFYVWQDGETLYCLDGKHRVLAMQQLQNENHFIPGQLPATFIDCADIKEAAKYVLIYSSIYARITQPGLFDFLEMYELHYDDIVQQMSLPDFSEARFEQSYIANPDDDTPEGELPSATPIQHSDIFEINGHRIGCFSFTEPDLLCQLMDGKFARILNCDPPYNLPANFFVTERNKHEDFAMAHGEMTDEEFVKFLQEIMQTAVRHTVPGAIHYIFMDWRHVWHMTEAARNVYGSPQPKQLCVWNKDIMANGSFYRAKHELCFVFNTAQAKSLFNKDLLGDGGNYRDDNELCFIFKNGDEAKHLSHLELKDRIRTNVWDYPSASSTANPDRYQRFWHMSDGCREDEPHLLCYRDFAEVRAIGDKPLR